MKKHASRDIPYPANKQRLLCVHLTSGHMRYSRHFFVEIKNVIYFCSVHSIFDIKDKARKLKIWDITNVPLGIAFYPIVKHKSFAAGVLVTDDLASLQTGWQTNSTVNGESPALSSSAAVANHSREPLGVHHIIGLGSDWVFASLGLGEACCAFAEQESLAFWLVIAWLLACCQAGGCAEDPPDIIAPAVTFLAHVAKDGGELVGLGIGIGVAVIGDADVGALPEGLLPVGGEVASCPGPL